MMKKLLLAAAILFAATPALAQTQGEVANHAVPIGKGPGFQGFGAAAPGAAGQFLGSNGAASDPSFQSWVFATVAQYYAGTASGVPIPPSIIYPAEVTLPAVSGGTLTIDFSTFIDAAITLNANVTTQTLVNVTAGKDGMIVFVQPAAGGPYTTVWNTIFKFSGALPSLSTAANAVDVLSYSCRSATFCVCTLLTAVHNP